jgi:hypothetical protein
MPLVSAREGGQGKKNVVHSVAQEGAARGNKSAGAFSCTMEGGQRKNPLVRLVAPEMEARGRNLLLHLVVQERAATGKESATASSCAPERPRENPLVHLVAQGKGVKWKIHWCI